VAVCVQALMAERGTWEGTVSDLLRAAIGLTGPKISNWPQNPAALAGRPQTFLRMLGIEVTFTREGRAGTRTIKISAGVENRATIVGAVGSVSAGSSRCHNISTDLGRPPQALVPSSRC